MRQHADTMKPGSAKDKGRRFQKQIVQSILSAFPSLEGNDVVSTSMGANGTDVRLSPTAERLFPYSIECKNVERINIWEAIAQCEGNSTNPSTTPIVAFRRDKCPPYAVVPWDHFIELASRASTPPSPPRGPDNSTLSTAVRKAMVDLQVALDVNPSADTTT